MDSSRWTALNDLVADALDARPSERDAILDAEPDADLRAEARALVRAHTEAEGAQALDSPFDTPPLPGPVGPWTPTDRLGAGGMGVVYAAERMGEGFRQRAALKLIRPGFGPDFRDRFLRERAMLASLDHPGVARLLDGGVTADGLPYLAMELVEGEPITDFAQARDLALRARLGLFIEACAAVAHAHRHLVVHRDLKPAHIIVTTEADARVKLLDFGIAKLLDGTDDGLTQTRGGPVTPQYASPEQLAGHAVTTATDVYSLGVVLYELLTDRKPYDLKGLAPTEAQRIVAETVPLRPSANSGGSTDTRRLRGDLDTVVLKALAKEPERRYSSVEAFADDIRRFLDGLPVHAQPDRWGYRAGKFVRRHRAAVVAGVVALAAIVGGAGAALWQADRAAQGRDRTALALAQAEGTLDYLESAILLGDPQSAEDDPPLSVVLDSAAARVDAEADPAVAAAVHRALASVYLGRGAPDRAAVHAERAARALASTGGEDYVAAETLWGQALADGGDAEAALPHHLAALAALELLPGDAIMRSVAHNTYGSTLFTLDRLDDAEGQYRLAIDAAQAAGNSDSESTALQNLAVLLAQQERPDEAAETYTQLIAVLEGQNTPQATYGLAFARIGQANALAINDQDTQALAAYRQAVPAFESRLGADHPETTAARLSYAFHLHKMGRFADARRVADQALATAQTTLPDGHPYLAYAENVAGTARCDAGDPTTGAALLQASLDTRRASLPPDHWILANGESLLGACLARLGDRAQARRLLTRGADGVEAAFGADHQRTRTARDRLAAFERGG